MLEWAYSGVNGSVPRNVGPECADYLTPMRRIVETIAATIFVGISVTWGLKRITLPKPSPYVNQDRVGKRVLLILMSLILGMEIGFKFSSRTVIYLLNPCHVTTVMQVRHKFFFRQERKEKKRKEGGLVLYIDSITFLLFFFCYSYIC